MIRLNWLAKTDRVLKIGAAVCGFIAAASTGITYWKSEQFPIETTKHLLLAWNEAFVPIGVPVLTVLAGALTFFKTHFGTKHVWKAVTHLLEDFRNVIFAEKAFFKTDPVHHNRVTLYKFVYVRVAFCWPPFCNWMVPVARTGFTTHSWRIPRFRAPSGNPDKAEGVAGVAYSSNGVIDVNGLPDLSSGNVNDARIRDYARKGFVSENWVRTRIRSNGGCTIRSMVGVPIEVNGKRWGVLVVDSRHRESIYDVKTLQELPEFERLVRMLSKLLEN